jgi:hypothetical protein
MHLPGLMWQLCLVWVYVCHTPFTDAPPQPAGPGAPKILTIVTTIHPFDHIAGILC